MWHHRHDLESRRDPKSENFKTLSKDYLGKHVNKRGSEADHDNIPSKLFETGDDGKPQFREEE